ncbi:TonB-dependent receptor [Alterisphingorhabdus coralli]|uniref:TonB-dependent receptor n=1 Tax=Alterisphingorhabdus coralli TaxID=3071408 RepID=A0AA97FCB6_9SPHN|nr:carboxypeptidase regulatory-like domain-containing protein [Parasphingorhabdus sp. SCSIO 66989]WOE76450.1 TonB-dependent receptor [Parasphingorhabdus sp. SCSIO 66989]
MQLRYYLAASAASLSLACGLATPAAAQQIVSGIEGSVTDADGNALPGATVVVTDTRTNTERTTNAGNNGTFRIGQLPPGGPYTVTVTAPGYAGQSVESVFTNISGNTSFNFRLDAAAADVVTDVIVVTAARAGVTQVAVGPGTAFGTDVLENFPSVTRDIRDIIRIDPRVSLEQNNDVDRISCLGGNDRSNTFTVDGIVQSDVFGLNGTPFAARNAQPIPFDVIEQTSVEFAPFDVEYTDFTGCLVNVVTKAGQNDFHGSAFITYFDEGLQNDTVIDAEGDAEGVNAGRELRWGATLSGPIIKDTLFFSFGYEEVDIDDGFNRGPFGSSSPDPEDFVTQQQFDEFARIARDVYGQDIGGLPGQLPEGNTRYFGRLDWNIAPGHRAEATYQRLEETNVEFDGGGNTFTGFNSFEDEGTVSDKYSLRLYSEWSDRVSTELRISRAEVGDVQGPVGFGEAQSANPTPRLVVGLPNDDNADIIAGLGGADNGGLATGPGIFRSANQLDTKIDQARFILNYDAGNGHFLKFGAELNDLEVFNLFAINATGTLFFNGLDDFEQGLLALGDSSSFDGPEDLFERDDMDQLVRSDVGGAVIRTGINGDINNAAAEFSRRIYSFFVQDDWQATDQLSITAGIRAQLYDGDAPRFNQTYLDRFGINNAVSFSQIDPIFLPRLSATYEFFNEGFLSNSRLTGGVGIFSGGDPVVFFSNAFSNDGFASAEASTGDCAAGDLNIDPATGQISVLNNGQFTGMPQCAVDAAAQLAETGQAGVQTIAPDLEIPTALRANIGFNTDIGTDSGFFSNWNLQLDYIYTRFNNTLNVTDLSQAVNPDLGNNGFTVDGREIRRAVNTLLPGCNATLVNTTPPTYENLTAACFDGSNGRNEFIQLNNGPDLESHNFSFILSKQFDRGVFTEGGRVNVNFGYAFSDAEQTNNFRSSTATSTIDNFPAFNRQDPAVSQSGFETRHNFTFTVNWAEQFFDDYDTRFGLFFRASEGRPYSLVFDDGRPFFDDGSTREQNALLYVPTGLDDPNLSPLSDPDAVTALLGALNNGDGVVSDLNCNFTPGQTVRRNQCRNEWFFDMDIRISQEIPGPGSLFGVDDRIEVFADFFNFLNLIDSDWNARRQLGGFQGRVDLVDGAFDDDGRYIIRNFNPAAGRADTLINNSIWRIQFGARYEF